MQEAMLWESVEEQAGKKLVLIRGDLTLPVFGKDILKIKTFEGAFKFSIFKFSVVKNS
jgi:hypothetical protein